MPGSGEGKTFMQSKSPPVAIVGNINLDVKTGPLAADPRLFRDGETSVGEIYETVGGGGANTAVAAAGLGAKVVFCGAVGRDTLGQRLQAYLTTSGITPRLAFKQAATGRSIALNWEQHQRHFVSCLPSSALLEADDIDLDALAAAGCAHFYRADIWFAPLMLQEGNLRLLRGARRLGMHTSIDINWDPHWHAGRDDARVAERIGCVKRLLPDVTYAHGNERELRFFSGTGSLDDAVRWFFDQGAQTLIVHLGPGGSAAYAQESAPIRVPAAPVARIVSEAGTGDVFTAAFLQRDNMDLCRRLTECNAIAAKHLSGETCFLSRLEG